MGGPARYASASRSSRTRWSPLASLAWGHPSPFERRASLSEPNPSEPNALRVLRPARFGAARAGAAARGCGAARALAGRAVMSSAGPVERWFERGPVGHYDRRRQVPRASKPELRGTILARRRTGGEMQLLRIVVVALVAAIAPATASAHGSGPLARTEAGLVRGFTADHTEKFLGIPYAAAPVGARRWRAPAPAAAWHGVRDATQYGARCPQLPSSNGAGSENEDCLSLNVFTPTGPRPRHHRPVLVFIHGGGLINGSGDQHDGAAARAQERHRGRLVQLPARRLRLPRPPVAECRGRRSRLGRLRRPRPAGGDRLGAPQHRRLRGRSAPRHDRRRVGGWLVGLRAAGVAADARPARGRDHPERQLCESAAVCSRERGHGVRRLGGLPGHCDRRRLPAREVAARPARRDGGQCSR